MSAWLSDTRLLRHQIRDLRLTRVMALAFVRRIVGEGIRRDPRVGKCSAHTDHIAQKRILSTLGTVATRLGWSWWSRMRSVLSLSPGGNQNSARTSRVT